MDAPIKIKSVERICQLANEKKAVYMTWWKKEVPAAFVHNWNGRQLVNMIGRGEIEEVKY